MAIVKKMLEMGVYHIENNVSNFATWSKLMIDDLGPNVKPYLREIMEWSIVLAHKKTEESTLKNNCWDYYKCGKQAEGDLEKESDLCPAYLETKLNGVHNGKNGGRACWIVQGTKCGGRIKKTLVPKFMACKLCDFKKTVINEESHNFIVSDSFMKMLIH